MGEHLPLKLLSDKFDIALYESCNHNVESKCDLCDL